MVVQLQSAKLDQILGLYFGRGEAPSLGREATLP